MYAIVRTARKGTRRYQLREARSGRKIASGASKYDCRLTVRREWAKLANVNRKPEENENG